MSDRTALTDIIPPVRQEPQHNQSISSRRSRYFLATSVTKKLDHNNISSMATKEDISNMATKEDISNMATKEDISSMATKEDISNMATKEDLSNMATKKDISNMATKEDMKCYNKVVTVVANKIY